jgi:hypothetical protein
MKGIPAAFTSIRFLTSMMSKMLSKMILTTPGLSTFPVFSPVEFFDIR